MIKKLISVIIASSAMAGILPCAAFAEDEAELFEQLSEKSFTYTENFDNIPDGQMPDGWTLYRNKSSNASKTIKAEVRNGALELTDNNYYSKSYVIFDLPGLVDVKNQNLSMECDITLGNSLGIEGDNKDTDCVGFAYGFDESKISADNVEDVNGVKVVNGGVPDVAAYRVKMFTNKGEDTTNQLLANEKYNQNSLYRLVNVTSDIPKINTEGTEQKIKLKIAIQNANYYAYIYLNGEQVKNAHGSFVTPDRASGKIGFYINDTAVTIDNVVVNATGMVPDTKLYTAGFKTPNGKYIDAENAKEDVEVWECDCFGNRETDVTADSVIDATEDVDGNITIDVAYGEFTKTLTTKVADFDLIAVGEAQAFDGGLKVKVSNNSKKKDSAVIMVCPMKDGEPFGKNIYYKTVTLEAKEKDKEAEFKLEYDGDNVPDS